MRIRSTVSRGGRQPITFVPFRGRPALAILRPVAGC